MAAFSLIDALRGGIEGGLSAMPEGVHIIQGLRQAAQQHAELAERKRQFDADEALRQREFQQRGDIANREQTLREQEFQRQGQMDLQGALDRGAVPVTAGTDGSFYNLSAGGNPIPGVIGTTQGMTTPVDRGRVQSLGGRNVYQPTAEEQLATKVKQAKALQEATGVPLYGDLADLLNVPEGTTVPRQVEQGLITNRTKLAMAKQPQEKPDELYFNHTTDDQGNVTTNAFSKKTGDVVKTTVQKGAGAKREDPDAKERAAAIRSANAALERAKTESNSQLSKDLRAADKTANDTVTKLLKPGQDGYFDHEQAIRDAHRAHAERLAGAQNDAEEKLRAAGVPVKHNDYAEKFLDSLDKLDSDKANKPAAANPQSGSPKQQPKGTGASVGRGGAKQVAQRMRVKLADGRTGTIDATEFDPKTMQQIR